jgi:hypothetical protein
MVHDFVNKNNFDFLCTPTEPNYSLLRSFLVVSFFFSFFFHIFACVFFLFTFQEKNVGNKRILTFFSF